MKTRFMLRGVITSAMVLGFVSGGCRSRSFEEGNKPPQSDPKIWGFGPNGWWDKNPVLDKEYDPMPEEAFWTEEFTRFIRTEIDKHKTAPGSRPEAGFHRGFHGKGQACLKGELTVAPGLTGDYKAGVFATERKYPVWARFSNGNGPINADTVVQPRGLSFKVMDVAGEQLLPSRASATTQDFLAVNSPAFPNRNIKEFVQFSKAQGNSGDVAKFLLTHPHTALILAKHLEREVGSLLTIRYWSGGAIRWGKRASKFSMAPCAGERAPQPRDATAEFLTDDLRTRMSQGEACFNFFVQLQTDPVKEPVEDPSIEWEERRSKPQLVGTVRFPKQSFESTERKMLCEDMLFNAWQGIKDHQPIGNIMRARKAGYEVSSAYRHAKNGRPVREPDGSEP